MNPTHYVSRTAGPKLKNKLPQESVTDYDLTHIFTLQSVIWLSGAKFRFVCFWFSVHRINSLSIPEIEMIPWTGCSCRNSAMIHAYAWEMSSLSCWMLIKTVLFTWLHLDQLSGEVAWWETGALCVLEHITAESVVLCEHFRDSWGSGWNWGYCHHILWSKSLSNSVTDNAFSYYSHWS